MVQLVLSFILLTLLFCSLDNSRENPQKPFEIQKQACITKVELYQPNVPAPDVLRYYIRVYDDALYKKLVHNDFTEIYFYNIADDTSDYRNRVKITESKDGILIISFDSTFFIKLNVDNEKRFEILKESPHIILKLSGKNLEIIRCN